MKYNVEQPSLVTQLNIISSVKGVTLIIFSKNSYCGIYNIHCDVAVQADVTDSKEFNEGYGL